MADLSKFLPPDGTPLVLTLGELVDAYVEHEMADPRVRPHCVCDRCRFEIGVGVAGVVEYLRVSGLLRVGPLGTVPEPPNA